MEIGGKMPAYCPIDELSMCKLSRARLLLSPFVVFFHGFLWHEVLLLWLYL